MIEKLKVRWGINSNFQILKIFVVFAKAFEGINTVNADKALNLINFLLLSI